MRRRHHPPAIGRVIAEVSAINQARADLARATNSAILQRDLQKPAERPITARPVGAGYAVRTRGRVPEDEQGRKLEGESIDRVVAGEGCFRRMPTCRD